MSYNFFWKKLINLFYLGTNYFTILWWFLPYINMNHRRCTCVPHPEPPSHLLPHPIPLGYHSAPTLNALFHASYLDWSSISHMVKYMFQCCSLKSFWFGLSLTSLTNVTCMWFVSFSNLKCHYFEKLSKNRCLLKKN